jgi:site-specific DNA-methyltransferase (adenine-specific)
VTDPRFTIYLKDSFEWLKSLPDASVDLVVTDPPYSSLEKHRATGTTTRLKVSKGSSNEWFGVIGNDRLPELMRECYRVLRNDRHCYVFTDPETLFFLKPAAEEAGFEFRRIIVWDKVLIGMGYGYRRQTEFVLYLLKGKRQVADLGTSDLLRYKRVSKGYPTEKPVELIETFIRQSAKPGELVIDPFLGSGSTGVAALRRGCRFLGCDISPKSIATAMPRLIAEDTALEVFLDFVADSLPPAAPQTPWDELETEEEIERRVRAAEPLRECACDGTGECSWCERGVEESARVRQMEEQLRHEYELRKETEWR